MITICTAVFVLINWVILRKGIIAGIERSVKFLMPLLFLCLIVMVARNLTLDGAWEGVRFLSDARLQQAFGQAPP